MARGRKADPNKVIPSFEDLVKEQTGSVILDKSIYPYYIKVEEKVFTIFKAGQINMVSNYSDFGNAVKRVAQMLVANNPVQMTLGDYVLKYREVEAKITNLFKF